MKATELRIGTLVFASAYIDNEEFEFNKDEHNPKEWTIEAVTELSKDDEYYIGTTNDYVSERVKPIPLTSDILKLSGFEYMSVWDFDGDCDLFIWMNKGVEIHILGDKFYNELGIEIEFVHQLQNLYFSLTNKELKINLK